MKLAVTAASMRGVRTTPEDVAEVPITPCTNSGTYEIVPNMANPTRPIDSTLALTVDDDRIKSKGRIGSGTRDSIRANTASSRAEAASTPTTCGDVHAYCSPPQTRPSSSAIDPSASTPAPSQST